MDSYGKAGNVRKPEKAALEVEKKRARTKGKEIIIEYANDRVGMRQNFIVNRAQGEGNLRLEIQAHLHGVGMLVDAQQGGDLLCEWSGNCHALF